MKTTTMRRRKMAATQELPVVSMERTVEDLVDGAVQTQIDDYVARHNLWAASHERLDSYRADNDTRVTRHEMPAITDSDLLFSKAVA